LDNELKIEKKLIGLSVDLIAVLDALVKLRAKPRGAIVEKLLWHHPEIKKLASNLGIENPKRVSDLRGRWKR